MSQEAPGTSTSGIPSAAEAALLSYAERRGEDGTASFPLQLLGSVRQAVAHGMLREEPHVLLPIKMYFITEAGQKALALSQKGAPR